MRTFTGEQRIEERVVLTSEHTHLFRCALKGGLLVCEPSGRVGASRLTRLPPEYANQRGLTVVHTYAGEGKSGSFAASSKKYVTKRTLTCKKWFLQGKLICAALHYAVPAFQTSDEITRVLPQPEIVI